MYVRSDIRLAGVRTLVDPIGRPYPIGYPGHIDGAIILQTARRAAGLTQTQLAELAGTSQATLSAYERGTKSPSLNVAVRILQAAGLNLSFSTYVDFEERKVRGVQAFWFPNMLWTVGPPDCFATLRVPDLINHTEQSQWHLSNRTDRARAYEILIRRALPESMIRWLDGALLVDLWDELDLPSPVRSAWSPAIKWAMAGPSVEMLWDAFMNGGNPSRTATIRIGERDALPPPPPPPPRRRADPVNGHPWG